jgi:Na+/proline symporter
MQAIIRMMLKLIGWLVEFVLWSWAFFFISLFPILILDAIIGFQNIKLAFVVAVIVGWIIRLEGKARAKRNLNRG